MNRRHFISTTALSAAALNLNRPAARSAQAAQPAGYGVDPFIDTNVYLSRWPFRRVWADETGNLVAKLAEHHVTTAMAGSFDALFHKDISAVNESVATECTARGNGILMPVGAINPTLPDWEEDLRRCHELFRMRAIRVHPNYHGYRLDDPRFARLVELTARRRLVLQVPLVMEDERTQNPLVQVPPVEPEPLVDLLKRQSTARVMLLNCFRRLRSNRVLLTRLVATRQIAFDVSWLELMGGIEALLRDYRDLRLIFGSYAPFFHFESAALKLTESVLTAAQLTAIRSTQAAQMLGPA